MAQQRSSQPGNRGMSALSTQPWLAEQAAIAAPGTTVGGWRQWQPPQQRVRHRTLRVAMARYFRHNGCK